MTNILLIILIQFVVILLIVIISYKPSREEQTRIYQPRIYKEEEKNYLTLQNMSTYEILTFKDKKDFYKTIEGLDTIRYFLKGTEEENNIQLVKWYYPGYRIL